MKSKTFIIYSMACIVFLLLFVAKASAYTPEVPKSYLWHDDWTLYPHDADLTFARDMFFERKNEPQALASWENGSIVMFPIHIKEAGKFEISIEYSRKGTLKKNLDIAVIITKEPTLYSIIENIGTISANIENTESVDSYINKKIGTLSLPQGSWFLMITNKENSPHEYVMKLSKVHLKRK